MNIVNEILTIDVDVYIRRTKIDKLNNMNKKKKKKRNPWKTDEPFILNPEKWRAFDARPNQTDATPGNERFITKMQYNRRGRMALIMIVNNNRPRYRRSPDVAW